MGLNFLTQAGSCLLQKFGGGAYAEHISRGSKVNVGVSNVGVSVTCVSASFQPRQS